MLTVTLLVTLAVAVLYTGEHLVAVTSITSPPDLCELHVGFEQLTNTRCWPKVCFMLAQRRSQRDNIKPTLDEIIRLVFVANMLSFLYKYFYVNSSQQLVFAGTFL